MIFEDGILNFSATDLSTYSACSHATLLDLDAAAGNRERPHRNDPALRLLQERGLEHEQSYLKFLEKRHNTHVLDLGARGLKTEEEWRDATEKTLAEMRRGAPVLYQAAIADGRFRGYVDFLVRVDHEKDASESTLGSYHYSPVDTKLAREAKASAVLQLCVYAVILERLQGRLPEKMLVASPIGFDGSVDAPEVREHEFRVDDFAAYFRRLRGQMESFASEASLEASYPEPCAHCDVCSWWEECNTRRRADDHLSFVAGLASSQRTLLGEVGIKTLESLAKVRLPLANRPKKLAEEVLDRVAHQAKLQWQTRETGEAKYELLPAEVGRGLALLPEPTDGDIFFDIEADRYARDGALHYLLGWTEKLNGKPKYTALWAHDRNSEREAFEKFIAHVVQRRNDFPNLHVFHFAPFEKTALGQMSLRYLSKEAEVDALLRGGVLVDLLPVVKQGLRAGVESYSIKELEQFYGFARETELREASQARRIYELQRSVGGTDALSDVIDVVTKYNREDCESALLLRDWLEERRSEVLEAGNQIPRPSPRDDKASKELAEWARRVESLRSSLLRKMPESLDELSTDERGGWLARKLLADLLDWHWREAKPALWEHYRGLALTPEEAVDDSAPIGGLGTEEDLGKKPGPRARVHRYRYSFPDQEYSIKLTDSVSFSTDGTKEGRIALGNVVELDRRANTITVERSPGFQVAPRAMVKDASEPQVKTLRDSLVEIAESLIPNFGLPEMFIDEWDSGERKYGAARALLLREPPKLLDGGILQLPGEVASDALRRVGALLSESVLPVQGPPGAGKSYSGSEMILELVRRGKKVGITATSHRVISNLLEGVHEAVDRAAKRGERVSLVTGQRANDTETAYEHAKNVDLTGEKYPLIAKKLRDGSVHVLAGTAWLWTNPELRDSVDVLVVDEAGQFSLANALAVSVAAKSLVLLGDPQQLSQPLKGSHPEGAEASALEHLLGGKATVEEGKGLFLESTWRLPPPIAEFTSKFFYEGRLRAHPDCVRRELRPGPAASEFAGAGLFYRPVVHEGNVNHSDEEAGEIVSIASKLLSGGTTWCDREGDVKPLEPADILVVAPYNSQVHVIQEALHSANLSDVRVGTVDKFQGQEAPVVLYSMTTSSPEDAPRGLEFLYSLNRLNVAISRSEAIAILIASPRLLEASCRTPDQMRLVNALCGAVEMAEA